MVEWTMEDKMFFKLNFTKPLDISDSEIDTLRVTFTNTELLFDMFGQ